MSKFTYEELMNIPPRKPLKEKEELVTKDELEEVVELPTSEGIIRMVELIVPFIIAKCMLGLGWILSIIVCIIGFGILEGIFSRFRKYDKTIRKSLEKVNADIIESNKKIDEENAPIIEYNKMIDEMEAELNLINNQLKDIDCLKKISADIYHTCNGCEYFNNLDEIFKKFVLNSLSALKYNGKVVVIKEIVNVVEYRDNNVIVQLGDSSYVQYTQKGVRVNNFSESCSVSRFYRCILYLRMTKDNIESAENMVLGDSAVCVGILRFENGVDFHLDDAIILNVNSKPTKYLINQFFKENELKTNTIN